MAVFSVSSVKLGQEKVPNQILQKWRPYTTVLYTVYRILYIVQQQFFLDLGSPPPPGYIYEACESGLEKGLNQTKSSKMAAPYHCTVYHGDSTVPWWQHCALVAALCPGVSTMPWWQHYAMVVALCHGGSTVPWWQHCAAVAELCYGVAALSHGGSTEPGRQHCARVAALCHGGSSLCHGGSSLFQGGSTVPRWQHCAMVAALRPGVSTGRL